MALVLAGAIVLSRLESKAMEGLGTPLARSGACLARGLDNNASHRVSLTYATWVANGQRAHSRSGLAVESDNLSNQGT